MLAPVFALRAQQRFFKTYSVESGLPFVQVSCIFQDSNAYLWSGGYGGLSRFDGKTFLNFNKKNGLIDHNVNVICSGADNDIFVGTNRGLSVLRNDRFTNYNRSGGLSSTMVTALCRGAGNLVYIGTSEGMFIYKAGKIAAVDGLQGFPINHLYRHDNGALYISTYKGLVIYQKGKIQVVDRTKGLSGDKVNVCEKFGNRLVIGTDKGLSIVDPSGLVERNYGPADGLKHPDVTALCNQDDSILWIGSVVGLQRFDGTHFEYYNIGSTNNSNLIRCILRDRENNIWTGTHNGLSRYRDDSFITFDRVRGPGAAFVFSIFRDKNSDLWVCTKDDGVFRGAGDNFIQYGKNEGSQTDTIRCGREDSEGRLLFGTARGLIRYKNGRFFPVDLPPGFKGPYDELYEATDKTLWIGGTNGIASISWVHDKPVTQFFPIRSNVQFNVYGFCQDDKGRLYIGTYKAGLFRLNGEKMENLSKTMALGEETFFTLRYMEGRIFSASLNGVLVVDVDKGTISKITDKDGLNSELIYAIEVSRDKNSLWVGTNQGINKLNLRKYIDEGVTAVRAFGVQEGFAGVECNTNGIWEDKDGTLWFGTVNGLIKFQPFNYRKNQVENITHLQNIRLFNEDTLLANNCVLASDQNNITFYYRGICLTNPDKVLYRKKLEGLPQDKDWSNPGTEDYIKFSSLAPGRYTFRVNSANNEGVWNKEDVSFSFRIKPPFYLTWWFILASLTGISGSIYTVFRVRVINIKKKQKRETEIRVEMSKIELKALRSQMNPHFIFNSLNAIQHYIFNTKSEEAAKYLNKFAKLVRIILNNTEKTTVTVGEDMESLKLYLELEQMRFEDKFEYEIIVDDSVDLDYDIMPPLLMQPYVENAILHGLNPRPEKGKLTIRLHSENNFLICTIVDNGIGRQKAFEIRKSMQFGNYKSFGMKLTEDRLRILNEIHDSDLSVTVTDLENERSEPAGTKVELYVPLGG